MHHDARFGDLAVLEGLPRSLNGMCAIKGIGQRWMKVDDGNGSLCLRRCAVGFWVEELAEEVVGEDVHPASEDDQVGSLLHDKLGQMAVVVFSRLAWVCCEVRLESENGGWHGRCSIRSSCQTVGSFSV